MQEAFSRLLAEWCTEADVRRVMAQPAGYDDALWRGLAEMGIVGLLVDPDFGGSGAGPRELELLMETAGAALLPSPWFASGVLAASLLGASTDEAAKARLLPEIAAGTRIATVALASARGTWIPDDVAVTAMKTSENWRLDGEAAYVLHAGAVDTLLVVAKSIDGIATFEVDPKSAAVSLTPVESFDRTLRFSRIKFTAAPGALIGGAGERAVETMLDLARIALAGEQAGAARKVFEMTVEYIKLRVQFGRPVGGFQAIKHMAADLLIEVESAISAARHAALAQDEASPETRTLISLASFACADAFSQVAAASIQMHGGIGFTWEHPCHLYLRRARADARLLGDSNFYRDRYVASLEASGT